MALGLLLWSDSKERGALKHSSFDYYLTWVLLRKFKFYFKHYIVLLPNLIAQIEMAKRLFIPPRFKFLVNECDNGLIRNGVLNSFMTKALSYRNQDWFLYDNDLRHERVNMKQIKICIGLQNWKNWYWFINWPWHALWTGAKCV